MVLKTVIDFLKTQFIILDVHLLFGEQFNHLVETVSSMRNSDCRWVRVAVAIFLIKMRLALSNRILAVLFYLNNKRTVFHIISQVRTALVKDFVPSTFGFPVY